MQRLFSFALAFALVLQPLSIFAQNVDTGIVDRVDKQENKEVVGQKPVTLDYKSFSSCQDMNTTLTNYVRELIKEGVQQPYMYDYVVVEDAAVPTVAVPSRKTEREAANNSSPEVSTTNIQIAGVDEPDILKTNGKIYAYSNAVHNKIYLINSPLDHNSTSIIDISTAKIVSTIILPKQLQGQNTQLFISDNTLIIIANRHSPVRMQGWIDKSQKTMIISYDITTPTQPKLIGIDDMDGYYTDARLVNKQLHVLTTTSINRWGRIIPFLTEKDSNTLNSKNLFSRTTTRNAGEKISHTTTVKCSDINYLLPSIETIKETGQRPQFSQVTTIDIAKPTIIQNRTVVLAQPGQIHMSKDSLYLTQSVRLPNNRSCPANARCMMPIWGGGDSSQTLIHKFDRRKNKRGYVASTLIPGNPLNQYSMEEDENDNFRILTSQRSPQAYTNFYILDNKLNLKGKIEDIAPGENFQSSRYIDDKLYLVTFHQTDPLFVIDIADTSKPKIVGALKIPGYSTYLHPHSIEGSKQYLIGLGYDVGTSARGGTINKGIQLALYEVDYANKETADSKCGRLSTMPSAYKTCLSEVDTGNIRVSLLSQQVLGGEGSISPALYNPRVFVMNSKKNITMPVILADEKKLGESCTVNYDSHGKEIGRDCYPQTQQIVSFIGIKQFSSSTTDGIKEIFSQDYSDKYKSNNNSSCCVMSSDGVTICPDCLEDGSNSSPLMPWNISNDMMRVGYAGDALFFLSENFGHFILPRSNAGNYIELN